MVFGRQLLRLRFSQLTALLEYPWDCRDPSTRDRGAAKPVTAMVGRAACPHMFMLRGSERVDPIGILVGDSFVSNFRSAHPFFNAVAVANQAIAFILVHGTERPTNPAPQKDRNHGGCEN